jgi:hypothetical protein
VDVVLCYSPDRLARKFAYQALLIEEFARAGCGEFVKGPRGDTPEDQLMAQFQGMFAEYEKAQLMERYRRGKAHRAGCGSVNVLGGAPFGYRYINKTSGSGAGYEIAGHEAAIAAELFRRCTDDGASFTRPARPSRSSTATHQPRESTLPCSRRNRPIHGPGIRQASSNAEAQGRERSVSRAGQSAQAAGADGAGNRSADSAGRVALAMASSGSVIRPRHFANHSRLTARC